MSYYKWLDSEGTGGYSGWAWPTELGKWLPDIEGDLEMCGNGYHVVKAKHLLEWLPGRLPANLYAVSIGRERLNGGDKICARRAKPISLIGSLDDGKARLFACDCAEHVLHIYERDYPGDSRVRNCIEIARKVANGDLPVSELAAARAAALAADGAADGAAARAAAWDAEREWQNTRLLQIMSSQ